MELKEFTYVEAEGTKWETTVTSAVLYSKESLCGLEKYVLHAEEGQFSFAIYPEDIDRTIEMLEWCKAHRDARKAPVFADPPEPIADDPHPVEEDG